MCVLGFRDIVPYSFILLLKLEIRSSEMLCSLTFRDNLLVPSSRDCLTLADVNVRLS